MNKTAPWLLSVVCSGLLVSCDTATPENYFDRAVLNCNLMHGFAGRGLYERLATPSFELSADRKGEVQRKRKEIIDTEIASLESGVARVRKLKETEDSRDILQASIALYEYVLPVYRNEYQQLARLYDEGAAKEQTESLALAIEAKYRPGFEKLYDQLTAAGKPYAARHNINVKWDVSTEPSS